MNRVFEGHIEYRAYLDPQGQPVQELPAWIDQTSLLNDYYRTMLRMRLMDAKATALQRTGQMGTYASVLGQEAIGVVAGLRMRDDDVFVPYYRDHIIQVLRGTPIEEMWLYWGGDERGNASKQAGEDFPNCVPVATQCGHAVGIATAIKLRHQQRAVLVTCGDGATSKGDFLEALNLAGVWQLPVVFLINNNQWAISVPRRLQCGAPTLAQKALGAGIRGEQVDGNDVIALHESLEMALQRARADKGATLIEALSYRLGDHTTSDDASRYRNQSELEQAWQREPVVRLRRLLEVRGAWDDDREQALRNELEAEIQQAAERYLATPPAPPELLFDHLYANLPPALQSQRQHLLDKAVSAHQPADDHHE